ncbi:Snt1p Ecym_8136 [Eremothecium cymbalariae DBVPG|uniref:Uncharacterized protein n=1 Tax=Eremothecium cymbalariae (strain CBS 270.75 / DBVPG 7215 / KCTC 17166 / NRRL Y-17582) TaxID=931890 RepID=G8JX53_ERECY|nr:Hypothetical protein Ecym_8136 [Eremothecium cymbalariae DBVPG\
MPISQRLGEKKRYHYSGNSRNSSYSRGGHHSHNPTQYHHTGPTPNQTVSTSHGSPSISQGTDSRPSRYDPKVSLNNKSFSPRTGSRYNPDPSTSSPLKKNAPDLISRYSGTSSLSHSRYNPQVGPPPLTAPTATTGPYQGYNSYGNQYSSVNRHKPRTLDTTDLHDNTLGSNGYASNSGKWRDSNMLSSSSSSSNMTNQQLDYDAGNSAAPLSASQHYRRSNSAGNSTPKYYRNINYGTKYGYKPKHNGNDGIDDRYEMPKSKKNFDNQHSLGSSLINSVPMTTKKIGKRVANAHKRIDLKLEENVCLDDSENESIKSVENQSIYYGNMKTHIDAELTDEQYMESREEERYKKKRENDGMGQLKVADIRDQDGGKDKDDEDHDDEEDEKEEEDEDEEEHGDEMDTDDINHRSTRFPTTVEELAFEMQKDSMLYSDYTDPLAQRPHVPKSLPESLPYPEPLNPVEGCIFPMLEPEMKLWLLKNRPRKERISKQTYLLKVPIKELSEYPFMSQNILIHKQAIRPILLSAISKLKHYEFLRTIQLKKKFLELQDDWTSKCDRMDKMSERIRRQEIEEKKRIEEEERKHEEKQRALQVQQSQSGLSRRRNRADFVDDAEIESVLLQIDPDYKHHQLAATIPPMIIDPVKKYSIKFKDVSNLVTDKDAWASRVITDAIDTFSDQEHEQFVEAYLSYPKRFGKISNYMGGLRTPEECALHYYKTKKAVKYKKLIMEKNKKRKSSVPRRRKEKEREKERSKQKLGSPDTDVAMDERSRTEEPEVEFEKTKVVMEQVEVKVMDEKDRKDRKGGMDRNENDIPYIDVKPTNSTALNVIDNDNATEDEDEYPHAPAIEVQDPAIANMKTPIVGEQGSRKRTIDEVKFVNTEGSYQPQSGAKEVSLELTQDHQPTQVSSKSEFKDIPGDEEEGSFGSIKKRPKNIDSHHRSSYWSVRESDMFPSLLKEYGSQWHLISDKLGTKSTTMVRNYYQRKAEAKGWQPLLEEGNSNYASQKEMNEAGSPITNMNENNLNGTDVPPQQAPALGYFNIDKPISPPAVRTPTVKSVQDSFSQQTTPKHGLPSQHLPSIQLRNPVPERKVTTHPQLTSLTTQPVPQKRLPQIQSMPQHSVHFSSGTQVHETQASDISRRSSIRSLLNENNSATISRKSSPPVVDKIETTGSSVIIQELNASTFSKSFQKGSTSNNPYAVGNPSSTFGSSTSSSTQASATVPPHSPWSSITSILNPAQQTTLLKAPLQKQPLQRQNSPTAFNFIPSFTQSTERGTLNTSLPPVLPLVTANSSTARQQHSVPSPPQRPLQQPTFNFANDPLAALAAVASAPEALGLISNSTNNTSRNGNRDGYPSSSQK